MDACRHTLPKVVQRWAWWLARGARGGCGGRRRGCRAEHLEHVVAAAAIT